MMLAGLLASGLALTVAGGRRSACRRRTRDGCACRARDRRAGHGR